MKSWQKPAEGDISSAFPAAYKNPDKIMETVRGKDNRLIVGITGSIACGKTTVGDMLEQMGVPVIDFDIIARQVVEPGTPGLEKIVDYFGKQVLQEDGALDRKKLSKIVFRDSEKRKKLESITHPAIFEEFFKQVNDIAEKKSDAIIQVAVPLLIELNMQYLFDKIVVVYIPEDKQAERLTKRDGITGQEAADMLKSQMSVNDKVGYADFIIKNDGTLEETGKQVQALYHSLANIQKERIA
ncbi:MAG: dephospho-CoA kinase [Desulfobacterales bacterium]|nr:dephospho-CoA kinase [Desulfobacterales bacterium]